MRDLVAAEKEPITPLVDRVTSLTEAGVSLIMSSAAPAPSSTPPTGSS